MSIDTTRNDEAKSVEIEQKEIPKLPIYCDYFKFFLVEELSLEQNFSELHYGKCALIGKLRESSEGDFLLENIKLPSLPCKYSLPEGSVEIRLLRLNYFGAGLRHGRFCEVCGELVLLDVKTPANNRIPLTSRGVCEQLSALSESLKNAYLQKLLRTHKPALKLWHLTEVDRASELAERNLEIRMLCQRKK